MGDGRDEPTSQEAFDAGSRWWELGESARVSSLVLAVCDYLGHREVHGRNYADDLRCHECLDVDSLLIGAMTRYSGFPTASQLGT